MRVEVINTGTELLLGHVVNTHLRALAEALFPLGLRIQRQITVPDGAAIREALAESFARADAVFVTGGLGPTTDDVTRELAADLLGLELEEDAATLAGIAARFAAREMNMTPRNRRQAMKPRGAELLPNAHGTAPGIYFPPVALADGRKSPHLFLLPGPPRELLPMLASSVLPRIRSWSPREVPVMQTWRVIGVGESAVEDRIGPALEALGVELGYCARPGEVDVRVIGAPAQLAAANAIVRTHFDAQISGAATEALEAVVIDSLRTSRRTVAVAESCTGGLLAHRLTNVPGASDVFLAGFVTYANEAKFRALGVPMALIETHGAVSEPVAAAMAEGARRATDAYYALATTGIAGPGGGTALKPVGTVFIALASRGESTIVHRHSFPSDRSTFKELATQAALELLRTCLVKSTR